MRAIYTAACLLALPLTLAARDGVAVHRVGERVPDFALSDTAGKPFQFYSLAGKKAAVLFFMGSDCPIAKLYAPRLAALAKRYEARGVAFIAINANASESAAQTAKALKAAGVAFPALLDPDQRIADMLNVKRTCESFVVDGTAVLRYRGAVDDQYTVTERKPVPTSNYLEKALEAVLAERPVTVATTTVQGCLLDRLPQDEKKPADPNAEPTLPPDAPLPTVGKVSYYKDIAPILQEKCQSCHRPGQVGPFTLGTYAEARRWTAMIGETVQTKRMPPWHADPHVGTFANDRSLTPLERATVLGWVKQGAPEGNKKDAPKPKNFTEGWNIPKPDVILTMEKPYLVQKDGVLPYQWFRVPTNFTEDKWVQAVEVRPGARAVVHHVIAFIDDHTGAKPNGLDGFLGDYVPGESPTVLPVGVAKRVPKGADLLFQVHYTPVGTEQSDQSKIGIVFAKEPPKAVAETIGIVQPRLQIPANTASYKAERWFEVPTTATMYSYAPHMHFRGKAFRMTAHYPDGKTEPLLSVPKYDFNWQTRYMLTTPKTLPKGTSIHVEAWYDNSKNNPANPDPNRVVPWGEQTFDEMMIGYVDFVVEGARGVQLLHQENMLGAFRPRRKAN